MFRAAKVLIASAAFHGLLAGGAFAQCCVSCAPSCAVPSCAAPCYAAPTCACPGVCSSGCQSCQSCQPCGHDDKGCHKKGLINISLTRTINRSKRIGFGEAPPVGFAVASIPAMTIATSAVPVNFATAAAPDRSAEIAAIAAILAQQQRANAATAAAASGGGVCNDPCGDIKQLQTEVQQLKQITVNLTNVVEKLVADRPDTTP